MSMIDTLSTAQKLDSELLRTFIAVAECGSMSAGAERIFRSQSATSLQIKRLELLLGQPVFARHGRGVMLTPIGERLLPTAQQVVAALDGALVELRSNPIQGSLRVGIPDEFGHSLLPAILAAFAREHPRVELNVQSALSAAYPEAIERGLLDIAIFDSEIVGPDSIELRRQRICWAGARRFSIPQEDPVPLALFDRDCWWRHRALQALQDVQRPYRIVYTSETVAGVRAAIQAGIAVGLLYADDVNGDLVELSQDKGFPPMADTHLVMACRRGISEPLAEAMAQAMRSAFERPATGRPSGGR